MKINHFTNVIKRGAIYHIIHQQHEDVLGEDFCIHPLYCIQNTSIFVFKKEYILRLSGWFGTMWTLQQYEIDYNDKETPISVFIMGSW